MGWRSYIIPQTLARYHSRYNSDICIVEERGNLKLLVNGSPQSGPYIERLWRNVLHAYPLSKIRPPRSFLVLGVAGGTVIKLLRQMYPDAPITAVDIDKCMIVLGRKYFGLNKLPRVHFVCADASVFVSQDVKQSRKYDCIVVDVFTGRHIPAFVDEKWFWHAIRRLTAKQGTVLLNYLRENEYRDKSNMLLDKLRQIFHSVNTKEIFLNRFMIVRVE